MKYLFIMNAASDGWRICYVGGNKFEFYNSSDNNLCSTNEMFVNQYQTFDYHVDLFNNIKKYQRN
jgi:hypothetical protein